jgi:inhibitor of cysteine peptidase
MKKSKALFAVAAAVLAASMAAGPATAASPAAGPAQGKVVTATDRDNNETIHLNVGDKLVVRLASNPSTNYSWKVGQINQQLLRLIGEPKFAASTSGLMGAPGTEVFEFEARAAGGEALALLYQNPTLRGTQAANTFRLRVIISDPAKPGKTIVLTDADNNETVQVAEGDTLVVRLQSTPSTGYSWSIADNVDLILKPEGNRYVRPTNARPGASGYQEFTFSVIGNGEVSLKMLYQRPWQRSTQAARAWQVFVETPGAGPKPAPSAPTTSVTYACRNNDTFTVEFGDKVAKVTYGGVSKELPQKEAADGFLYADDAWELRGVGATATLTDLSSNTVVGQDCLDLSKTDAGQNAPVSFVCAGASSANFTVLFGDKIATVTYNGVTKKLEQQEAADGFLYADAEWELRGKGNEAVLTDLASGTPVGENCTAQPSAAVSAPTTILANYTCDDGVTFAATFGGDVASVTFNNETKTLKQQQAADGFSYTDGAWELRGAGDVVTLTDVASGKAVAANCKSDAQPPTATPGASASATTTATMTATAPMTSTESAALTILTNYACDDNVTFAATFGNNIASVTFNNVTKTLQRQPSADGFRYADAAWELRGAGDTTSLTDLASNKVVAANCKAQQ